MSVRRGAAHDDQRALHRSGDRRGDVALVRELGFTGGRVLEPGCGAGVFIGLAPAERADDRRGARRHDRRDRAALYPARRVIARSFADTACATAAVRSRDRQRPVRGRAAA